MIKVLYLMANVIAKRNEEDCLCIKLRQEYFEMQCMSRSSTKCHVLESVSPTASQGCPLFYLRHGNCDDDICSNGKANVQNGITHSPKSSLPELIIIIIVDKL